MPVEKPVEKKDSSHPYSRKHLKYWLPVLGGMLLIGFINVALGLFSYQGEPKPPEKIIPKIPKLIDAPVAAPVAAPADAPIAK